ncbi:hypothetical protein L6164_036859 [Bauhinia variegata]|uniref:Uncharacterized protein n=1 Tax=Bauhinia variegata TaxID=167791 RepID=A0ACB9KIB7_BAUVA|nr:hypothetical protein L6164_036859 [Bauhinia variegata]
MHVRDASILPKGLSLDKLKRYKLLIGDVWKWSCKYETSKTLKLKLKTSIHSEYGLKRLLGSVEALYLDELIGIKDVVYELDKNGFPYLQHLCIQNNSQIQCIVNSTHEVHIQDVFPKLESLVLANMIHLEIFCERQITEKSFQKLRVIEVESCHKLKSLFSISLVRCFSQLEEIKISSCKIMKQIVDLVSQDQKDNNITSGLVQFCKLRSLTLKNLSALFSFCFDDTRSYDSTMSHAKLDTSEFLFDDKIVLANLDSLQLSSINCQNIWQDSLSACSWVKSLTNLKIERCGRLRRIFSIFQAMRLVNLKRHEICKFCGQLEEVVAEEENANGVITFNLSHLQTLTLVFLAKFKGFFPGMHILECPKLKRLVVVSCPEVALFEQEAKNIPATPLLSVEKVVPYLDFLGLNGKDASKILKGRFREDLFHNIATHHLYEIETEEAEFLYGLLHRMPNLKCLYLIRGDIRDLFPIRTLVSEKKQTVNIVRIRDLRLRDLPSLESICIEGSQLDPVLENLEELQVISCPSLEKLVPTSASLNCLTFLRVISCDGLKHLFSPSTARSLVHLKEMRITECKMLQEIVAKVEDDNEDEISFGYLESLELEYLSNLSSFCSGNNNFDFPYLEKVTIKGCPTMKIFSQGQSKSLRLQSVNYRIEDQYSWEGDLNSTIRKLYEGGGLSNDSEDS